MFVDIRQKEVMNQPASTSAIYFDDQLSGDIAYNNTFIDVDLGILMGGGRSHHVFNNTFIRCPTAVHLDDRGLTWQKQYCAPGGIFDQELVAVNYTKPPFSTHYPQLPTVFSDNPCVPVHNVISDNRYCGPAGVKFLSVNVSQVEAWHSTAENNNEFSGCGATTAPLSEATVAASDTSWRRPLMN